MVKAIIFDCFGVVLTDALQAMIDEFAASGPDGAAKAARVKDLVLASIHGFTAPDESSQKISELFGLSLDDYRTKVASGEVRNEPLLAYILELRKNYQTAMLSNVSNGGLLRRFTEAELHTYFDVTIASSDIGFAKPESEAYEIVADKLGVRLTECVMIDDREDYCAGARTVGMQAIRYESFGQLQNSLSAILKP